MICVYERFMEWPASVVVCVGIICLTVIAVSTCNAIGREK
jgi:hypothetical protein